MKKMLRFWFFAAIIFAAVPFGCTKNGGLENGQKVSISPDLRNNEDQTVGGSSQNKQNTQDSPVTKRVVDLGDGVTAIISLVAQDFPRNHGSYPSQAVSTIGSGAISSAPSRKMEAMPLGALYKFLLKDNGVAIGETTNTSGSPSVKIYGEQKNYDWWSWSINAPTLPTQSGSLGNYSVKVTPSDDFVWNYGTTGLIRTADAPVIVSLTRDFTTAVRVTLDATDLNATIVPSNTTVTSSDFKGGIVYVDKATYPTGGGVTVDANGTTVSRTGSNLIPSTTDPRMFECWFYHLLGYKNSTTTFRPLFVFPNIRVRLSDGTVRDYKNKSLQLGTISLNYNKFYNLTVKIGTGTVVN